VAGTVAAVRARYPGRRIVAVFEPRTNTSRRAVFQADYVLALRGADRVVIAEPPPGAIYSATGEVTEFLSVDAVARELRMAGAPAEVLPGADAIAARLAATCAPGDVVLVMSNGGFDNVWEKLLAALAARR
jgi:UDP-N-acetylmuramate: L-alanyl-gamma-D-glutamyl-meso-diaminopimelate ligase